MGHRAAKTQLFDSKVRLTKKTQKPIPAFVYDGGRQRERGAAQYRHERTLMVGVIKHSYCNGAQMRGQGIRG